MVAAALVASGCFDPDSRRPGFADSDGSSGATESGDDPSSPSTSGPGTSDPSSAGASTSASASSSDPTTGESDPTDETGSASGDEASSSGDPGMTESGTPQLCEPATVVGCDGDDLVTCNDDGTAEESSTCLLGCDVAGPRCFDVDPANDLAEYLDVTASEPELDLGGSAEIDTDDGTVTVDGTVVAVANFLTDDALPIRVLAVGSLVAGDVEVIGSNALAIVSAGDIQVSGHFSVSARGLTEGPGALSDPGCTGLAGELLASTIAGVGGGGFGTDGSRGGSATNQGTADGGDGGGTAGNVTLVPLRGGCNSGPHGADLRGRGGGALQMVSRTSIVIQGIVSSNGSSGSGGGSGGGILLEAPSVEVSGNVVANGGSGAGGGFVPVTGEDGRIDDEPADGGAGADTNCGAGGDGAAGATGAQPGQNINQPNLVFAGHGGGGMGRIRVNVLMGGLSDDGIFSPNPTTGAIGTR